MIPTIFFYVLLSIILPKGLVGLLIAVIFLAAWGSIAAALNALASCTVVDIHKIFFRKDLTHAMDYRISKIYTLCWGIFCIAVAEFASNLGNSLIETVNILGSLFYGVILGIFLVAFWFRQIKANAIFYASVVAEIFVIVIYKADVISFLWLNVIGALLVIVFGYILQLFIKTKNHSGLSIGEIRTIYIRQLDITVTRFNASTFRR